MLAASTARAAAKPPQGDEAKGKKLCADLVSATAALDKGDGAAAETRQPRHHRLVFAKAAVAGQRREIFQNLAGVIEEMGATRMTRHLHLLPGRQPRIGIRHQRAGARLQDGDFAINVHAGFFLSELAQLDDLSFQLGNGTFKFQVMHGSNHTTEWENGTGIREREYLKNHLFPEC